MPDKTDWTREKLEEEINSHVAVTIPVNMQVESQQRILDFTEADRILKEADLIAVGECYCRKKYKKCDGPLEVCLNLDKEAQNFIERGLARKIVLKEALEVLKRSHEAGLVHITYTFTEKPKPELICSCCSCCCHSMSALVRFGMAEAVVQSEYVAENNPETCISCGKCVERCQFEARCLEDGSMRFDRAKCFGCGVCVTTCPTQSISLVRRASKDPEKEGVPD